MERCCTTGMINGAFSIHLHGEIDLVCKPDLQGAVAAYRRSVACDVVVDLAHVTYLGFTGLELLFDLRREAQLRTGHVFLRSVPAMCWRAIHIVGLGELLPDDAPVRDRLTEANAWFTSDSEIRSGRHRCSVSRRPGLGPGPCSATARRSHPRPGTAVPRGLPTSTARPALPMCGPGRCSFRGAGRCRSCWVTPTGGPSADAGAGGADPDGRDGIGALVARPGLPPGAPARDGAAPRSLRRERPVR